MVVTKSLTHICWTACDFLQNSIYWWQNAWLYTWGCRCNQKSGLMKFLYLVSLISTSCLFFIDRNMARINNNHWEYNSELLQGLCFSIKLALLMYKNWLYTWDYMLELYQEVIYVVAPYICTEEPRLMFHKSEQW